MISIEELENPIQEYPWGSYTAISDLLGQPSPSRNPQAELWMGAHPRASSMMTISGKTISLYELIKKYPGEILGKNVQKKFGASLPFLFKVLAAEKPLSIQVHPNIEQAKEGYEKETKKGIPLDSDERNYKDDNHKPECICAITDFWLLNGFRKISDIVSTFETLSNGMLADEILQLRKNNSMNGLKQFFKSLMSSSTEKKQTLINSIVANVEKRIDTSLSYQWIIELHNEYGKDIGILAPLLLNLICLRPGEVMFLSSGELHAYLKGMCIELMANSDNVIRGGLTSKHVDIIELFRIVHFQEKDVKLLIPQQTNSTELFYPCDANEFILSRICLKKNMLYTSSQNRSVEIIICVDGDATLEDGDTAKNMMLEKGTSALIPATVNTYQLKGEATIYKAAVPL